MALDSKVLQAQREMLKILGATGEDYLFLRILDSEEVFFTNGLDEKYPLDVSEAGICTWRSWCRIVCEKDLPALRTKLSRVIQGELDSYDHEYRILNRQGNWVWIDSRGKCITDEEGNPVAIIGRVSDTYLKDKVDWLTGSFNAQMLTKDIGEILKQDIPCYLLLVGVDGLKNINLRRGREWGNQILQKVADTLGDLAGEDTRVYRVSGDCFAVNIPTGDPSAVKDIFARLNARLAGMCTVSAGAVSYHEHRSLEVGALHQYAEDALYKAKRGGQRNLAFFSQQDYEQQLSSIELQEELKQSVENGMAGFSVYYQPQIRGGSCELFGVEALMRFHSESRGDISPAEFIPVLEQSGLICEAGLWILRQALEQCRIWRADLPELCMSVNISYVQLDQEGVVDQVLDALRECGLPGSALILEITESIQLQDFLRFNQIFYQWKQAGIQIAVDDFGTGYSSLGYLKHLDIDEIKIDRCFVKGIQHSAYNYRLLSNILELARPIQIRVCCEGVETQEELAVLKELQVDLLQGFLFDKPLTAAQLEDTYLRADTEGRKRHEALKQKYHWIQPAAVTAAPQQDALAEFESLNNVMDAFEDPIYVSDLASYDLYYLNPAARRLTGVHDYRGQKCYKVLQGLDEPCSFCTNHLLDYDRFYSWELTNKNLKRHFMCKDKLIFWQGKPARMELAVDISEKEDVSLATRKKLDFAENVLAGATALAEEPNMHKATRDMLRSISEFYQADRAYVFEPSFGEDTVWTNTYMWDRENDTSELKHWAGTIPGRWLESFRENQTIFIDCAKDLRQAHPKEWQELSAQKIRRMIITPVLKDGKLIGFIVIVNPRHSITDDSMVRAMSIFAATRVRSNEREEQLGDLPNVQYHNLLNSVQMGAWVMRIDQTSGESKMIADAHMRHLLGMDESMSPKECYEFWNSRIRDDYRQYMDLAKQTVCTSERLVQTEYVWLHPVRGELKLRTAGILSRREDDAIYLEGVCHTLSDMASAKLLPSTPSGEVFEYDPDRKTLRFQTSRDLLAGSERWEENFPDCWLTGGMVHNHFTQQFVDLLRQARQNGDAQAELMLRGKSNSYEWFNVRAHALKSSRDHEAVRVILDSVDRERVLQLEMHRMRDFYRASLSDSIAYLETDLDSSQLKSAGGLWAGYDKKYDRKMGSLLKFMLKQVESDLHVDDGIRPLIEADTWRDVLSKEETIHRFRYQRWCNNEWRWVELVARSFREQHTNNMFALINLKDVDAQVRWELAQKEAADLDPLTGIYNRAAFEKHVCKYMEDPEGGREGLMALLDIDDFKQINDTRGHLEGDSALQYLSHLLQKTFRAGDVVGRLGGDEFLIFLQGNVNKKAVAARMNRLFTDLAAYPGYPISCSAGIVRVSSEGFSYRDSLHKADTALYTSKRTGKRGYTFVTD